jgi:hypothetical protein
MPQREFANQKALVAYAEQNGLIYLWEGMHVFAKWQRLLSPDRYEVVEVRTSRGMNRAMLFSKAIVQAEWEANEPLREAMALKRERLRALRAKRAAKQRSTVRRAICHLLTKMTPKFLTGADNERGAKEVFHAVARFLDPATREILRTWSRRSVVINDARAFPKQPLPVRAPTHKKASLVA